MKPEPIAETFGSPDKIMVVRISRAELAVRLVEVFLNRSRPTPDPIQALAQLDEESSDLALRLADAAHNYVHECLRSAAEHAETIQ